VRWLALPVLVACGSSGDTKIDRAARATFALGSACCDDARYERIAAQPVADPDATAMLAAGVELYKPRGVVDVELCGLQIRSDGVMLNVFRGRLAQVIVSCTNGKCPGTDCPTVFEACQRELGAPAKHSHEGDSQLARYKTSSTFIRLVRVGTGVCELALQDAAGITALEAAMEKARH
jgi:hypothetical protein